MDNQNPHIEGEPNTVLRGLPITFDYERMETFMRARKLNDSELARQLAVVFSGTKYKPSAAQVSAYRRGINEPKLSYFFAIAGILDVEPNSLLKPVGTEQ